MFINNTPSDINLQARAGLFSRIFGGAEKTNFFDNADEIDSRTFANDDKSSGNMMTAAESDFSIFNVDDLDSLQVNSVSAAGEYSVVPDEDDLFEKDSYIIKFKSEPVATKTKELLKSNGVEISAGPENREYVNQQILAVKPQLDVHRAKIEKEQNKLVSKMNRKYSAASSVSGDIVKSRSYEKQNGEMVNIRHFDTSINAVSVENITEIELSDIVKTLPDVVAIEKVKKVKINLLDSHDMMNVPPLRDYYGANGSSLTGEGVTIGIVDTGIDYMHQDLGSCSFLEEGGCKVQGGYDFINYDNDPVDDHGHGTHVAATAAGAGFYTDQFGESHPLLGIAYDAKLYGYKVLSSGGAGSSISVVGGIEACTDPNGDGDISDHLDICSLSLGSANGSPLSMESIAADAAVDAGVVMTIAAGNDGPGGETIGSPGTSRKSITVGAACKPQDIGNDVKCSESVGSFSSRGPVNFTDENGDSQIIQKPDIVAPGVNICAAQWGSWLDTKSCLGDGEHIAISGTSMATPNVAGLMALLVQAHPDKTVLELKETLMTTAVDLGLDVAIQGQGMVDGLTTLEGLGIPNSIISISGLPFFIDDTSGNQIANYSQNFEFENISNGELNLTLNIITDTPGVEMTFPESLVIPYGGTGSVPVSVIVDHEFAVSGANVKEEIEISDGSEVVRFVISRNTPNKLIVSEEELDFGLFHESDSSYSKTLSLNLTNRMLDMGVEYEVSVDPVNANVYYHDNITYTTSSETIELSAEGEGSLDITLDTEATDSNPLANAFYTTYVTFTSPSETVKVRMIFFRGYAFSFDWEGENPVAIMLHGKNFAVPYATDPQKDNLTLRATKPGPYKAAAMYTDTSSEVINVTSIFELDIDLLESGDVAHYDVSKSLASHSIENEFFGNSCVWQFRDREGGHNFAFTGGGYRSFEYNTLPENYSFSLMCGDLQPHNDRIMFSQMYLTEGLNDDFVLNEDNSEKSTRYLYSFNNKESQDGVTLGVNICNFRQYESTGAVNGTYNMCGFWHNEGGNTLDLYEGEVGVVEINSLHTDTPETSEYPDYPAFRIHAANKIDGNENILMYTSAEMFGTQDKLYAWSTNISGAYSTETSSHDFYEKYKVDVVNNDFISVGVAPVSDISQVKAYQDAFGFIAAHNSSDHSVYRYADGSTETAGPVAGYLVKTNYNYNIDGGFTIHDSVNMSASAPKLALFPDSEGQISSYTPHVLGEYSISSLREGMFDGEDQNGLINKEVEFTLSSDTSIDPVPPFLKNVQLISNGLLQNHFDSEVNNEMKIYIDPGQGISYHNLDADENDAYEIEFMDDELSSFEFYVGDLPSSLTFVPVVEFSDYYSVDLSGIGSVGSKKYFKIIATDLAGNNFEYEFFMETGEALDPESLVDEGLLECTLSNPTVQTIPDTVVVEEGGESVPVEIVVTNNNTAACEAVSQYDISINTAHDFPATESNKIRVTESLASSLSNNYTTTGITATIDNGVHPVASGESASITIYLRADSGTYSHLYDIEAVISSSTAIGSNDSEFEPFDIGMSAEVVGDFVHPEDCGVQNPTISPNGLVGEHEESDSGTKNFVFTITNNNSEDCPSRTFSVQSSDELDYFASNKVYGVLNSSQNYSETFSLDSGESVDDTVYYKTFNDFVSGEISFDFTVSDVTLGGSIQESVTVPMSVVYGDVSNIPEYCVADFNEDGSIDTADLLSFMAAFNGTSSSHDLNGDGSVNSSDFLILTTYVGNGGCPVVNDPVEEIVYIDATQDPEIDVEYNVEQSSGGGSTFYDYEIMVTNFSDVVKENVRVYAIIPSGLLPFTEFIAASSPDLEVNAEEGTLTIPALDPGESVTVFLEVTLPF